MSTTNVIIIERNILLASSYLQKINTLDGFISTQIFPSLSELNLPRKDPCLLLVSFDFYTEDSGNSLRNITREYSNATIAVYANKFNVEDVVEAMKIRVSGFFNPDSTCDIFENVLVSMKEHGAYLSPQLAKALMEKKFYSIDSIDNLSHRELEICTLLYKGYTYEQIAQKCFISINTVRYYLRSLYRKYNVNSKMQLFHNIKFVSEVDLKKAH